MDGGICKRIYCTCTLYSRLASFLLYSLVGGWLNIAYPWYNVVDVRYVGEMKGGAGWEDVLIVLRAWFLGDKNMQSNQSK